MKDLFSKYKPVLTFLLLFLGSYGVLTAVYFMYLSWSKDGAYFPDFFTHLVSKQVEAVLGVLGYDPYLLQDPKLPMIRVHLKGNYIANINEGCNAISIMVLFISFIVAFAQSLKNTTLFMLGGVVLIYATNIIRIVILCIALLNYPAHSSFLHDIVFPGIIYGMVFLLWLCWVRFILKVNNE